VSEVANRRMKKTALIILGVLLIVIGAGLPIAAGLTMLIMPERFSSTARVIPSPKFTNPMLIAREMEKIQSQKILLQVVRDLNLQKKWGERLRTDELPAELAMTMVQVQLKVEQAKKTGIISVTIISEDKLEAANIANEIASLYITDSTGSDGKPEAQLLQRAQPSLRPYRVGEKRSVAIAVGIAALLIAGGVGVLLSTRERRANQHSPAVDEPLHTRA